MISGSVPRSPAASPTGVSGSAKVDSVVPMHARHAAKNAAMIAIRRDDFCSMLKKSLRLGVDSL
jgi:hypothetical protein